MIKDNIIFHDEFKTPLSLRALPLKPDCNDRIEYLFYTLNIARDFDDLTELLERVLDCPFQELLRDENRIDYVVMLGDKPYSLVFKVKERAQPEEA